MPLETSFNTNPYFDDFDQEKNFYRVLFKPSVAVQTRELNQLQTILQNQIERFGDHVFKSGTIVSGINFSYIPTYSFIKILDTQTDGQPSLPSSYVGYFIKNQYNLTARVINYEDGLESKSPDLKTLYLQYVNSSDTDSANSNAVYTTFTAGQQLTVFSKDNELFKITVNNGGLGFSNADTVVVLSALTINGTSTSFQTGEQITQSTTGAKAIIKAINTTAFSNSVVLSIKPLVTDLQTTNSNAWAFTSGYNISGNISLTTANVVSVIGSGAKGLLTTDSQGIVQTVSLSNSGINYTFLPHITIQTTNTSATISSLDIVGQNYKTTVTVANSTVNSVGTGYAFGISEGIIYQKGHFLRVDPQVIVVDKYTQTPNNVAVGFISQESIVDTNSDATLYDNASNTTNYAAPGANRLKITPVLTKKTIDEASANVEFLALAEWKAGFPYKENRVTIYNKLAEEFARRTREAQGNFVVDRFNVTTKDKSTTNTSHIDLLVDPGLAYVSGYRVGTLFNNYIPVPRSRTLTSLTNQSITINYGNYVRVKELAGLFNFKAGDTVSLRDTAKSYISSLTIDTSSITPPGQQIGAARIRSIMLDSGEPGTPDCVYRLYLFDIEMNAGYSFRQVRAIWFNGAVQDGIADTVLETDTTTGSSIAVMKDTNFDQMLFNVGQKGVRTIDNIQYIYRTVSDTTLQLATTGVISVGPLGTGSEFPYDGELSSTEMKDFIVMPTSNVTGSANIGGSITVTSGSATVTGTSTSFGSALQPGDYLKVVNATANVIIGPIKAITNNISLTLYSTASASVTSGNGVQFLPGLYPIPLENRDDRTIQISSDKKTATIDLSTTFSSVANVIAVYNVKRVQASPVSKTGNRDLYVKIFTGNNAAGNTGPWVLGIPDIIRLKKVYLGNGTEVNTNSTDVTKYFYIDTGDDENAYRVSKLVKNQGANVSVSANQYMLVQLDAFTINGVEGFFTKDSYIINDYVSLDEHVTTVNTMEIPEVVTKRGDYYDLRDTFDFRPIGANTANLSTTVAGATINPVSTFSLSGDDQLFPAPDSTMTFDITYFNQRVDRLTVNRDNAFKIIEGTPSITNPQPPRHDPSTITLAVLKIPQYPSLPAVLNETAIEMINKQTGNNKEIVNRRLNNFRITSTGNDNRNQPKRYTMSQVGQLERRIENLEYVTSLSMTESMVRDLVIPSEVTPSTTRFKYGFLVEPFDDYNKVDVGHREFAATIDQQKSLLKPPVKQFNFESKYDRTDLATNNAIAQDSTLMLPYVNEVFINQSIKSAVVGSDGQRNIFVGTGTINPASFAIRTRGEVTIIDETPIQPLVIQPLVPGISSAPPAEQPPVYGGPGDNYIVQDNSGGPGISSISDDGLGFSDVGMIGMAIGAAAIGETGITGQEGAPAAIGADGAIGEAGVTGTEGGTGTSSGDSSGEGTGPGDGGDGPGW